MNQLLALYIQPALGFVSDWCVPFLMFFIPVYGFFKGVKVYEVFIEGAREGFDVGVRIMPYLVAVLVAVGLLRDTNAIAAFGNLLSPFTGKYLPPEILPMALIRPLSGSGASGVMNSILLEHGPDSYLGIMASIMMGCTETTFYVLAVYFGAVNIKKTRHAVLCGIMGDIAGMTATVLLCAYFFGHLAK